MFKKVTSGEAIQIKAQEWNAMLEAAEAEINRRGGQPSWPLKSTVPVGCAWAVNHTGHPIAAGDVVMVASFAVTPSGLLSEVVLSAVPPLPNDARPLAVATEDCPGEAVFRIRLHGLALVRLATAPDAGMDYISIGAGGLPVPAETGLVRIIAHVAVTEAFIALALFGCGAVGEPPARGMFQLVDITAGAGSPTVRICDGAMPDSSIAGIANVNNQSYSCTAAEFALTSTPQYFYLKFTAPNLQGVSEGEPSEVDVTPAACEIVAFADDAAVVSTDTVVYRLIGHAWTETTESGEDGDEGESTQPPVVKIVQDHPVGNLPINWYGPCLDLLTGVTD